LSPIDPQAERRRRLLTRAAPVAVIGFIAFVAGALVARSSPDEQAAQRFVDAWERQDFQAMHAELTEDAVSEYPEKRFVATYETAETTATFKSVEAGEPDGTTSASGQEAISVPVTVHTHAFGDVVGALAVPTEDGAVAWGPELVFPGLTAGENLDRTIDVPERAPILAKDGTPLARGPATSRSSPIGTAATSVAGEMGTPKAAEEADLERLGFPPGSLTGTTGIEQAFNTRLAGQPGGELRAVSAEGGSGEERVLASGDPTDGEPVETTVDPEVQEATVAALGNAFGGSAVLDAKDGSVLGLAGIAFSSPQPPGSTFKIITTTAALEADIVRLNDEFPVQTSVVAGKEIANAHDEPCGGTFVVSFARSCNTVFAPLGIEVGNDKLVATAEAYGWNSEPTLYNAEATAITEPGESTIPKEVGNETDLAVSAIGQGEVLATPLQMASASQTIAAGGLRKPTALVTDPALGPEFEQERVTSKDIANTLRELMIGVVDSGTGVAGAVPGVEVAGKTGTAELGPAPVTPEGEEEPAQKQDAWFTAFAPASSPKYAVAVMIVNTTEDGGTVAAPIAGQILSSLLL
jgi:cell division protein FtsI/penicillin-binding protein 2